MQGILLDTHTILWMASDETKLGGQARELLLESNTPKLISPANYWEMAIKIRLGKLELESEYDEFINDAIEIHSLDILHIQPEHTSVLTELEMVHRDPFDRLLIAQAIVEKIPIVSVDGKFDSYAVRRIWDFQPEESDEDEERE